MSSSHVLPSADRRRQSPGSLRPLGKHTNLLDITTVPVVSMGFERRIRIVVNAATSEQTRENACVGLQGWSNITESDPLKSGESGERTMPCRQLLIGSGYMDYLQAGDKEYIVNRSQSQQAWSE